MANLPASAVNAGAYWAGLSKNADAVPYIPTLGESGIADANSGAYNAGYYGGTAAQVIGTGGLAGGVKLAGTGAKTAAKQIAKNIAANAPQKALAGAAAGAALSPAMEERRTGEASADNIGRDAALGAGMGAILPTGADLSGKAAHNYLAKFMDMIGGGEPLLPAYAGAAAGSGAHVPAGKDWFGKFTGSLAPESAAEEFRTGKGAQQSNLKPDDIQLAAEPQRDAANKVFSELKKKVDSRKEPLFVRYSDPKYDKSGAKSLKEGYARIPGKQYKPEDFEPGLSVWPLDYEGHLDKKYYDVADLNGRNERLLGDITRYSDYAVTPEHRANLMTGRLSKDEGIDAEPLLETVKKRGQIGLSNVVGMIKHDRAIGKQHDLRDMAKMLAEQWESGRIAQNPIQAFRGSEAIRSVYDGVKQHMSPHMRQAIEASLNHGEFSPQMNSAEYERAMSALKPAKSGDAADYLERQRIAKAMREELERLKARGK